MSMDDDTMSTAAFATSIEAEDTSSDYQIWTTTSAPVTSDWFDVVTTAVQMVPENSPPPKSDHVQFLQNLLAGFIVGVVKIGGYLYENLNQMLLYLIVSIVSGLIIILLGLTLRILVVKSAANGGKDATYETTATYDQGTKQAYRMHYYDQEFPGCSQTSQDQPPTCPHGGTYRAQRQHNTNRAKSRSVDEESHAGSTLNSRGIDRVRNLDYVYPTGSLGGKRSSAISSPNQTLIGLRQGGMIANVGANPGHSTAGNVGIAGSAGQTGMMVIGQPGQVQVQGPGPVTFAQTIGEMSMNHTHPMLHGGDLMQVSSFPVVRFQPQLLQGKISPQPAPSYHRGGDFDDYDD